MITQPCRPIGWHRADRTRHSHAFEPGSWRGRYASEGAGPMVESETDFETAPLFQ